MSKDLTTCTPKLQTAYAELKKWYETLFPGRTLEIGAAQRTPVEQLRLFCQGRLLPDFPGERVTKLDGFVHPSKHNALPLSRAVDIWIKDAQHDYMWKDDAFKPFGLWVNANYKGILRWGGEWGDGTHIEEG